MKKSGKLIVPLALVMAVFLAAGFPTGAQACGGASADHDHSQMSSSSPTDHEHMGHSAQGGRGHMGSGHMGSSGQPSPGPVVPGQTYRSGAQDSDHWGHPGHPPTRQHESAPNN